MKLFKLFGTKVFVKPSFIGFAIIGGYFFGYLFLCGLYGSIILHEIAHCFVAWVLGVKTTEFHIMTRGAKAVMPELGAKGTINDLIISMSGSLWNLIFALLLVMLSQILYKLYYPLMALAGINLILGVFNAIPALPLDGGRVLLCMLSLSMDRKSALKICNRVTFFISAVFTCGFLYFLLLGHVYATLLIVGVSLAVLGRNAQKVDYKYKISSLSTKNKFQSQAKKINSIVILDEKHIASAVSSFSSEYFNVIYVVDERGMIVKMLTELELCQ